jgi:hypothetical protein
MSVHRLHGHPGSHRILHATVVADGQIRRAHICRFPFGKPAGRPGLGLS